MLTRNQERTHPAKTPRRRPLDTGIAPGFPRPARIAGMLTRATLPPSPPPKSRFAPIPHDQRTRQADQISKEGKMPGHLVAITQVRTRHRVQPATPTLRSAPELTGRFRRARLPPLGRQFRRVDLCLPPSKIAAKQPDREQCTYLRYCRRLRHGFLIALCRHVV